MNLAMTYDLQRAPFRENALLVYREDLKPANCDDIHAGITIESFKDEVRKKIDAADVVVFMDMQAEWERLLKLEGNLDVMASVNQFRAAKKEIEELRERIFPRRTVVYVNCSQYRGYGVVVLDECRPDQIPVILENGNTWWYPIEKSRPADKRDTLPSWIPKLLAKHK